MKSRPAQPAPANLEMERAVLGAVLLDAGLMAGAIERLTREPVEAFHQDRHRRIYAAMVRLFERSEPTDVLTVAEELKRAGDLDEVGGPATLATLMEEAAVATQFDAYARTLRELAVKRVFAREFQRLAVEALNGGGLDDLVERGTAVLAKAAQVPTAFGGPTIIDAAELRGRTYPDRGAIVPGLVERESLVVVFGKPKLGKSCLVAGLLLSRAAGGSWLGHPVPVGVSFLFEAEIGERQLQGRLRLMEQATPIPPARLFIVTDRALRLDTPDGQRRIREAVASRVPPVDLVVFDPLARFMVGNENSASDMGAAVGFVDTLIQDHGVTVVLVHHPAKPRDDERREGGDRLRGSSALFAAADTVAFLERTKDGFTLSFELRHAPEPDPLRLERGDDLWFRPVGAGDEPADLQAVAHLAGAGRSYTDLRSTVQDVCGVSRATATRRIRQARDLGLLIADGDLYRAHGLIEAHATGEPSSKSR